MSNAPVILSQSMAERALKDPKFFSLVPEYSSLRNRQTAFRSTPSRGCGGCKKEKIHINLFKEFITITLSLNTGAQGRLKKYLGVGRLMMNVADTKTNTVGIRLV